MNVCLCVLWGSGSGVFAWRNNNYKHFLHRWQLIGFQIDFRYSYKYTQYVNDCGNRQTNVIFLVCRWPLSASGNKHNNTSDAFAMKIVHIKRKFYGEKISNDFLWFYAFVEFEFGTFCCWDSTINFNECCWKLSDIQICLCVSISMNSLKMHLCDKLPKITLSL